MMKPSSQIDDYQLLQDYSRGLSSTSSKSNRRVQLKMPSIIVDMLDNEFPTIDRSKLLTQAAIEILIRKKRIDNPELEHWVSEEQYDLDRMWSYLNEREQA